MKVLINSGFVKFYRSEFEHSVFAQNPEAWAIWSLFKLYATHKTRPGRFKGQNIILLAGQIIITSSYLSKKLGIEQKKVDRILKELAVGGLIRIEASNKNRLITITDDLPDRPDKPEIERQNDKQ